jgi:hypothetical protein
VFADIVVQLATVFVGAYFAFAAEDLRQRRQTREWAKSHLRQLSSLLSGERQTGDVATTLMGDQLAALAVWQTAGREEDLTAEQWDAIVYIVSSRDPDLGALLRGEPVALLPSDLAIGLAAVEGLGRELEAASGDIRAIRERVLPLWAQRKAPLDPAERRIVEFYRTTAVQYAELIERTVEAVRSVVVQIDAWAQAPK